MSDSDSQLIAEYKRSINITAKDISATLVIHSDTKVLIANRETSRLQLYMAQNFELLTQYSLEDVGWLGIADMALIDSDSFAALIPGVWKESHIRTYKIIEDNQIQQTSKFSIRKQCNGFCYQKGYFFVTCSPLPFAFFTEENCHVEMIILTGQRQVSFKLDKNKKILFGNDLSRIYVDKNFRMFVCDLEKNEMVILKIDSINRDVTVLTRHKYVVKDIATKIDGTSFLATSHDDGIVMLHSNGSWVFNNFLPCIKLDGKPLSVAFNETDQQLLVATQRSRWYSPWNKWLVIIVYDVKYSHCTDTRVTIEN